MYTLGLLLVASIKSRHIELYKDGTYTVRMGSSMCRLGETVSVSYQGSGDADADARECSVCARTTKRSGRTTYPVASEQIGRVGDGRRACLEVHEAEAEGLSIEAEPEGHTDGRQRVC